MKQELKLLLKYSSVKTGDFVLASGKSSKIFIDCKRSLLLGSGIFLASRLLLDEIYIFADGDYNKVKLVGGVAIGGCPLATAVSLTSVSHPSFKKIHLDALYIRQAAKDHGSKNIIEGTYKSGSNIILLEDVITTGGSSINALHILKEAGLNPVAVMSIVDRQEGGVETIKKEFDIPVISLFKMEELLK
jgi:orotate phosphoribosyltransferase